MAETSENPYATPEAPIAMEAEGAASAVFFQVGAMKLAVMYVATWGFYEIYWFYKNFRSMQAQGHNIWPAPRALFFGITAYSLFKAVRERNPSFSAGYLAVAVFLFSGAANLPIPWFLIYLLGFLPLLPVRNAIEQINHELAPDSDPNTRIRGWNYVVVVIGCLWLLLVLVGVFLPVTE